jgi:hypothetical protein
VQNALTGVGTKLELLGRHGRSFIGFARPNAFELPSSLEQAKLDRTPPVHQGVLFDIPETLLLLRA